MPKSLAIQDLMYPAVDLALARQLERAEATAGANYVEARRDVHPDVGAEWIEVAGVYAMFDGAASPITQTFGLGVFEPFLDREFDRVETFFSDHGAPTSHEVSSFAPRETLGLLSQRGYTPIEASTVLVRPTRMATAGTAHDEVTVRMADAASADEMRLWCRIAGEGWSTESPEIPAVLEGMVDVFARNRCAHYFVGDLDGRTVAVGALNVVNGIALMAGACTIPAARRRGAQRALLQTRLAFAADLGLDLAMVVAQPGSESQRNAERQGFRPMYTRAKWRRPIDAA